MTNVFFLRPTMSYAILSGCPPAAFGCTETKLMGYWKEGSTSTAIPPTSASDVVDQHNKIGGISFGAPLIVPYKESLYTRGISESDLILTLKNNQNNQQIFYRSFLIHHITNPNVSYLNIPQNHQIHISP